MRGLLKLVIIAALAWFGWNKYQEHKAETVAHESSARHFSETLTDAEPHRPETQEAFTCDGRTRCREMKSCAEARYFLKHCPGVQMDGDGDGNPCEDQFCGH